MITLVEINIDIQKQLDKDIKSGILKSEVRDLVAFWMREIQEIGFEDYLISNFAKSLNDHALSADRSGERSIYLNEKGGRLIYKYYKTKIIVKVIKITANHNYS